MPKLQQLLLVALSVICTGCATLQNQARVDPNTVAIYTDTVSVKCDTGPLPGDTRGGALNLACYKFPDDKDLAYRMAMSDRTGAQRNRLEAKLVDNANIVCNLELGRLTGNEAMVNTGFSGAATAASTIGQIVTGEMTRKIFLGIAGAANSTRDNFDAHVYRNVMSSAVVGAIMNERARVLPVIEQKKSQNLNDYPVEEMIRDVNEYHHICSFYRGLQLLLHATEQQSQGANIRGSYLAAIQDLDARADLVNSRLARRDVSAADKEELKKQLTDIRAEQTGLYKQLAAIRPSPSTGSDPQAPGVTSPSPPPEASEGEGNPTEPAPGPKPNPPPPSPQPEPGTDQPGR